jgi:hypothetical protein
MSPAPEEMISWVLAELTLAGAEGESKLFLAPFAGYMHVTSKREEKGSFLELVRSSFMRCCVWHSPKDVPSKTMFAHLSGFEPLGDAYLRLPLHIKLNVT